LELLLAVAWSSAVLFPNLGQTSNSALPCQHTQAARPNWIEARATISLTVPWQIAALQIHNYASPCPATICVTIPHGSCLTRPHSDTLRLFIGNPIGMFEIWVLLFRSFWIGSDIYKPVELAELPLPKVLLSCLGWTRKCGSPSVFPINPLTSNQKLVFFIQEKSIGCSRPGPVEKWVASLNHLLVAKS
jgi:hypothetical protein